MLDRACRLPSFWSYFSEECDPQLAPAQKENSTVRIVLQFKDEDSADLVRKQLKDLSLETQIVIQPVFVSDKIQRELKVHEIKLTNVKFTNFNVICAMQVMYAILLGTCTNALLNTLNSLLSLANTSSTNTVLFRKTRAVIFPFSGGA